MRAVRAREPFNPRSDYRGFGRADVSFATYRVYEASGDICDIVQRSALILDTILQIGVLDSCVLHRHRTGRVSKCCVSQGCRTSGRTDPGISIVLGTSFSSL